MEDTNSDIKRQKFVIIHNIQTPAVPEVTLEELLEKQSLLQDFLYHAKTSYKTGIGLAANQVAYADDLGASTNERFMLPVFAKKDLKSEEWFLVLKPKVIETHGKVLKKIEHCLTWPGKIITADRYFGITVEWYDIEGNRHVTKSTGFESQVWQHEINHLLGVEEDVSIGSGGMQAEEKVGRNDPCPCGSGKKYKKCCI